MLLTGIVFAIMAVVGAVAAVAAPGLTPGDAADSSLRLTGVIWAVTFGVLAPIFLYIGWPSAGAKEAAPGTRKAKATITSVKALPAAVAGYPLVELSLDIAPKDQMPYSVTRKFVANKFRRLEPGQVIDVRVDPLDPEKVELA
jgi:hypothetical protein